MRAQTIQAAPLCAGADHCSFALQRISALNVSQGIEFGVDRPWYEVLIRPHAPVFSGSPGAYIDHLYSHRPPERTDSEVLHRVFQWLIQQHEPTRVSINVHPESLTRNWFCNSVMEVQHRLGPLGHSLCLELIEFGECPDRASLISNARMLRHRGTVICLDDFGTWINCFDLCAAGIVDILKIDTSVVGLLHQDRYKRAIVESIAKLGSGIGAEVVAEGVECVEEIHVLKAIGVGFAQGFFFHKPELMEI